MKPYLVQTYSNVKAIRRIKATSPEEAKKIVDAEMKESLQRLIRTTEMHEDVLQISGMAGAEGEVQEEPSIEKCCICWEPAKAHCDHCETPYCGVHYHTTVMTGNCCRGNEETYGTH